MTIRRTRNSYKSLRQRKLKLQKRRDRRMLLEQLEDRRLLAFDLIGIQPADGSLLTEGDIRNTDLRELHFRFDDSSSLDPATLAGIQVTRSGLDGTFEHASAVTDFGTNGQVVIDFQASLSGPSGEGVRLDFEEIDLGAGSGPVIEVLPDRIISVQLNSNPFNRTTAFSLRNAIISDPEARALVTPRIARGNAFTPLITGDQSYSPLVLSGANSATAIADFGLGLALQVQFEAVNSGIAGNGITINFSRSDFGAAGSPLVFVQDSSVSVVLNTNPGNETSAQQLVEAVNVDPAASALVRARLNVGSGDTVVTQSPQAELTLDGANDVPITPGYIGIGGFENEVILRFAETLPDDLYRIDVFGGDSPSKIALRNISGEAYNEGLDTQVHFELDLGARILSVVPQPTSRVNGSIVQARDEIHVYFNQDPLDPATAEDPRFYQLMLTQETARNTDDVIFTPDSVAYDATKHRAILSFGAPLEDLAGGSGTFRLRIGTDEGQPLAPVELNLVADPGSSFDTATDLVGAFDTGAVLGVVAANSGPGNKFQDGDTFTIHDINGLAVTFEFDDVLGGNPGVASGNEQIAYTPAFTPTQMAQIILTAISDATFSHPAFAVTASRQGTEVFLDGDASVSTSLHAGAMVKRTQGLVVSQTISNVGQPYALQLPGDSDEPGHRTDFVQFTTPETHLLAAGDSNVGIEQILYNFQDVYGAINGLPLFNAITENQKELARAIFGIYGEYLGVQFIESPDQGLTIVTGDLAPLGEVSGFGGVLGVAGGGMAIMDHVDFQNPGDDEFGGPWFQTALHEIGHLLGLGHDYELPPGTVMGGEPALAFGQTPEPVFPGDHDIVHGQHLHRPESKDIDLYRFEVTEDGVFSAETLAERAEDTSLLDTYLTLYREDPETGDRVKIAQNDDYFSSDSYLELELTPGIYYLGVTASGNDQYDPAIEDTGFGGTTQGDYSVRFNFRPDADNAIGDLDNAGVAGASVLSQSTPLDGDSDGVPGGVFNFWFRAAAPADTAAPGQDRVVYVDKMAAPGGDGTMARPFRNLDDAINPFNSNAAHEGDILRIVGNGGLDGDMTTLEDNLSYDIGFSGLNGLILEDGATFNVPKGVTVQIDANAIFKLRRARIGVGSTTSNIDRSGAALQVFGVPWVYNQDGSIRTDAQGQPIGGSVYFTSLHDPDKGVDSNPDNQPPDPRPGDWGGLDFRSRIDKDDANRFDYEDVAVFLNHVNNAVIHYGGGNVRVDGAEESIAPIQLTDVRPTISYNTIELSAESAVSANPDSFEESNFHATEFQLPGSFTADYTRVGPDVYGNTVINNSINGLFVRITNQPGQPLEQLTVSGRWDDADMVHMLRENLEILGTPGGPLAQDTAPPAQLVTLASAALGGAAPLLSGFAYSYKIVYIDAQGNESPASAATREVTIQAGHDGVLLNQLPRVPFIGDFVARRLYRSDPFTPGTVYTGGYHLVAGLNANDIAYSDDGTTQGGLLTEFPLNLRPRLDARLRIDPSTVVKLQSAMIDVQQDAQFIAEGADGREIILTSSLDVRYGAGGTFETSDLAGQVTASPGDWAGVFGDILSTVHVDNSRFYYGGGSTRIGGEFRGFNVIELRQAEGRIANSTFEFNRDGTTPGGAANDTRFGRGFNEAATIFVRGAQPVIVHNTIFDNDGPAVSIDVNSLNHTQVFDGGRATGPIGSLDTGQENQGPLFVGNEIDRNGINALVVRGGTLTTQGVWDDTDIVHVLQDEVNIPDLHTYGGLSLLSKQTESLVIKLDGPNAGITATGRPLDINDRIGGALQVVGQPGSPVVMTSIHDCTVGAGFTPDGRPQTDTLNSGACGAVVVGAAFADVVVLLDDSGSMFGAQQFSKQLIADLEAAFVNSGVGDGTQGLNRYGLVAFGGTNDFAESVPLGAMGELFGDPAQYSAGVDTLTQGGATEDGYEAIHFALDNYAMRPDAAKFLILVTDEDRDILDPTLDYANTLTRMLAENVILESVVGIPIEDSQGGPALALDSDDVAYLADGLGGFTTSPNGRFGFTFDASIPDYGDLSHDTLGIVGDISVISRGGVDTTSFSNILSTQIVVQAGGGNKGKAGDWRSVKIDQYAHDRNVALASEYEPSDVLSPGTNFNPENAEFLGELAPHEKAGDETLRLGFEVRGALSDAGDLDVYTFRGTAGSEVWIDLDRTTHSLDSVVELVDADGNVYARSVNSLDEQADPTLLFHDPSVMLENHVNPLQKTQFEDVDRWSTNPRDAGMRLILPGTPGTRSLYYVRVRSNGPNLNDLSGGLTRGAYQMQIRLREQDEFPGSTVRYADIRFATNGIEVLGQPVHSPLQGEAAEVINPDGTDNNNSTNTATLLGNLLNTDRGTLAVSGSIGTPIDPDEFDVDWYRIDLHYDSTQASTTAEIPSDPFHVALTLDLDYADGLGRVDANVYVFDADEDGQPRSLVLVSNDSSVIDDLPAALQALDADDLSRGSFASGDPFVGTVLVPAAGRDGEDSGIYFIAVASNSSFLEQLDQFNNPDPDNPEIRLEPINSMQRLVEDHIDFSNGSGLALDAIVPDFVSGDSEVPYFLSDLTLFLQQDVGLDRTDLYMVNPFTGETITNVGRFDFNVNDMAMRPDDGMFYSFTDPDRGARTDATIGHYIQINPRITPLATDLGDDGIDTFVPDPAGDPPPDSVKAGPTREGVGIVINAIGFGERFGTDAVGGNPDLNGWAIGNRPDGAAAWNENILYAFNEDNGQAISGPAADRTDSDNPFNRRWAGAGTDIREHARIDTSVDPFSSARNTLIMPEATVVDFDGTTTRLIGDDAGGPLAAPRVTFGVDTTGDGFPEFNFEFNAGPDINFNHIPGAGLTVRDEDFFLLDGLTYEFDTGSVIVVTANDSTSGAAGAAFNDGDTLTIRDNKTTIDDTRIFEFNDLDASGPPPAGGRILIDFRKDFTQAEMIQAIVDAINNAPNFNVVAEAAQARISLFNDHDTVAPTESSQGLAIDGAPGLASAGFRIPVEETMDRNEFGLAMEAAFLNFPVNASADGARMNFSGALVGDFSFMETNRPGVFVDTGANGGVTPGFIAIPFDAADGPADISAATAQAIRNNTPLAIQQLTSGVTFLDPTVDLVNITQPPLIIGGQAPGGTITGMTFLGATRDQMFAVTDTGGLFRIRNYAGTISSFGMADSPAKADYIESAVELLFAGPGGTPVAFTALTSIPREFAGELLESGFLADIGMPASYYNDIMIGIDTGGRMYAFDATGALQPIFQDGASFIDTGLFGVRGIDFGFNYFNPAHVSTSRGGDAGHGINEAFDLSRGAEGSNASIYIGYPGPGNEQSLIPQITNSVDLLGGTHGAVESETFSLKGYGPSDLPTLYFNYFVATENEGATIVDQDMRDSFRVYVAGEDNVWHLLATNNSERGGGLADDEYDPESELLTTLFSPPEILEKYEANPTVEELFDVGDNNAPDSWRQARVNLSPFAGEDNLRLRFEFTTAGDYAMGDSRFTGQQVRTLPGGRYRDGQSITVTDGSFFVGPTTEFEFDTGISLVSPSPAHIADGDTFTVHGLTFEFDSNGGLNDPSAIAVPFKATQSAADVASAMHDALLGLDYTLTADLFATEPANDVLGGAVDTGLQGGSDRFVASGAIGDNPNLNFNPPDDVDLVELDLVVGDKLTTRVNAQSLGSGLDAYLRLFDAGGSELVFSDDVNGNDPEINFVAPFSGTYFLGISDSLNDAYDPAVEGSGVGATQGFYELEVIVNDFTGVTPHLNVHRVNLEGAAKVDAPLLPAGFVEGQLGVSAGAVAVPVHAGMTDIEVRESLAQAFADTYANGVRQAIKTHNNTIMMLGHNIIAQDLGAFGETELGVSNPFDPSQGINIPNVGDIFGAFTSNAHNVNNDVEGVYFDDIIIGFAERGEMVTAGSANTSFLDIPGAGTVLANYTLEARTSELYGQSVAPDSLALFRTFDTNDRITRAVQMTAPAGPEIAEADIFTITDGVETLVFEFDDAAMADGVAQGHVRVPYNVSDTADMVAQTIRDAINSSSVQAVLDITAALSDGTVFGSDSTSSTISLFGDAVIVDQFGSEAISENNDSLATANVSGIVGDGRFRAVGRIGDRNGANDVDIVSFQLDAGDIYEIELSSGAPDFLGVVRIFDAIGNELDFGFSFFGGPVTFIAPADGTYFAGVSSLFNTSYDPNVDGSANDGSSTGRYALDIRPQGATVSSAGVREFDDFGDSNTVRDQGQIILQSNFIRNAANFAINVGPGERSRDDLAPAAGDLPHAGPVRTTHQVNDDNLVPGVVVQNNVLYQNAGGGIRLAGENAADGLSPIPYGRIINNTVYSGGTGILIEDGAAPTVMNNILANSVMGVSIDASSSSTVLAGNLFYSNATHTSTGNLGNNAIDLDPLANQRLFLDPTGGLFYLEEGSLAVDSSVDQINDRPGIVSVKNPLGIAVSPMLSPELDAYGQLRTDDPNSPNLGSSGRNVFADRGALDRADFAGPVATLIDPRDNDAEGFDQDSALTSVLTGEVLDGFSIQLFDGVEPTDPANGVGVNDLTVTSEQVTVLQDGRRLEEGKDYRFSYAGTNNTIRLTPIAGIWSPNHSYTIILANSDSFELTAPNGGEILDGQTITLTDEVGNVVNFEFESGYLAGVLETFSILAPQAGGGLNGVTDQEFFTVSSGGETVVFEFDNNRSVASGAVAIEFTSLFTQNDLADAIVDALDNAGLGLQPKSLGSGVVHLGGDPSTTTIDLSTAPSLGSSGSLNGGVADGDYFTVDDGVNFLTYEFDLDGTTTQGDAVTINYTLGETHEELADKVVAALAANSVGLSPVHYGGGIIHIGGQPVHVIDMSNSSLTLTGSPGVTPGFGLQIPLLAGEPQGFLDGQFFTIGNGVNLPEVFEFDNDGDAVPGRRVVTFDDNSTVDEIADAVVTAISNVGLGLTARNDGSGFISLANSTANHFFLPETSPLLQLGQPGVDGSVAIHYIPDESFTAQQTAAAIAAAINADQKLVDVMATVRDDEVLLTGVTQVSGIIEAFVEGISDLAGNVLQANQVSGETIFTITIGSGDDYGDAPSTFPVTLAQDGARHGVNRSFTLGRAIDVDIDGTPTSDATGDDLATILNDEDGVTVFTPDGIGGIFPDTLVVGIQGTVQVEVIGVTLAEPGYVDAWMDFNGDGMWSASEKIIDSMEFTTDGVHDVPVTPPADSVSGAIPSRFRLSSTGGLAPTGAAPDGEVEDHMINVGYTDWHNGVLPADVTGNGRILADDPLRVINFLAKYFFLTGSPQNVLLPPSGVFVPPNGDPPVIAADGYMIDINNDGFAGLIDAQRAIAAFREAFNNRGGGEGEGLAAEGEGGRVADAFSSEVIGVGLIDEDLVLASSRTEEGQVLRIRPVEVEFQVRSAEEDALRYANTGDARTTTLEDSLDAIAGDVDQARDEDLIDGFFSDF